MQIISLVLKNFKQYKDETIKFPLGLLGFIGNNGSGKSSIFEAISLAFYGRFESNKEMIKNDKASSKDHLLVELQFEDKGKIYKVIRELRGKNLKAESEFFIDEFSAATGSKSVNREILKVLKIDYSNFKNSFFASQKEVTSLINLTGKERETAIRKMLGLEKLDKLDERIKERSKDILREIKFNEENLLKESELNSLLEEKKKNEAGLKDIITNHQLAQKTTDEFAKNYELLKKELSTLAELKSQSDSYKKDIELVNERISSNNKNKTQLEKEIIELKKMLQELKELEPNSSEYLSENKLYEELLKRKSEFMKKVELQKNITHQKENRDELLKERNELNENIERLSSTNDKLKENQKLLSAKIEVKNSSIKNKELINDIISKAQGIIDESSSRLDRIKEIGKSSNCPECERPLEDHYDDLIKKYKNVITVNEKDIKLKQTDLKNVNAELVNHEKEISELMKVESKYENEIEQRNKFINELKVIDLKIKKTNEIIADNEKEYIRLKEIEFDEKSLLKAEKKRNELLPSYEKYNDFKSKTQQFPKREEQLKEIILNGKELIKELERLNQLLLEIKFDEKKYSELKIKREKSELELSDLKDKISKISSEITIVKVKLSEIEKEIERDKSQKEFIQQLKKKSNLYERLKGFISEFKAMITSHELPAISYEASRLFSEITKNRYLNLKISSDFNFLVSREDKEVELQTLSGGEKDLASLCLRVAISKRISALAGRTNMGFLALDEVFGSQDEERREELMNALAKIASDFRQIFVVSHNQDVQEIFPQRLSISKVNGFSKVVLLS